MGLLGDIGKDFVLGSAESALEQAWMDGEVDGVKMFRDGLLSVAVGAAVRELSGGGGKVEGGSGPNRIPDNNSTTGHIFRDAEGHIPDTPENRALLENVANNAENFRGIDKYGNEWYTKVLENGKEVWVESRNGNIFEGGINENPKPWNPDTGLKKQ